MGICHHIDLFSLERRLIKHSNEFQQFLFDSIITADTPALAEDSWAAYRSPESFPPLESCLVLEAFGSNRPNQRAVKKLWTKRGKPRVMPAKNQYLLFATTDSYERSDSASSLSRYKHTMFPSKTLCFFLQRQRYPITVLLISVYFILESWAIRAVISSLAY